MFSLISSKLKNQSIKNDFILVVIFSSIIPFCVSFLFLGLILKNTYEKINLANTQIEHTQELEILDLFHKILIQIYEIIPSPEIHDYFASHSDNELITKNNLIQFLKTTSSELPFENGDWIIYGSRGEILLETNSKNKLLNLNTNTGTFQNKSHTHIIFSIPLTEIDSLENARFKKTYAYLTLNIPFVSIQKKFSNLIEFINFPQDLALLKFKAKFKSAQSNNYNFILFFTYIIIFLIFNSFAFYFGIKLLQNKIIHKLKHLTLRISHDLSFSSQKLMEEINNIEPANNEIDSLSLIFNKYSKYTHFLQYEIEKSSKLAAVGRIAHNLAHDLRKPFSQTFLFLNQLEKMSNYEEMLNYTQESKPALQNSMNYVEHLLKEIMEANINRLNIIDPVLLEDIILKSFQNMALNLKKSNVTLSYEFNFQHYLKIDPVRVTRIFINLIQNALEAMKYNGTIKISAQETHNSQFLEISILNNNSFIKQSEINLIFEPFYTKNKKNGTGLGLSIAQKIILLHGGNIVCNSRAQLGVEFVFTLPISHEVYIPKTDGLPKYLNDIMSPKYNNEIPEITDKINKTQKFIFIIDDDPFIGRSWKRNKDNVKIESFLYPENFLTYLETTKIELHSENLIISDFNFGQQANMQFYEFMLALRKIFDGPIFLSSDVSEQDIDQTFLKKHKILRIKKTVHLYSNLFAEYAAKIKDNK